MKLKTTIWAVVILCCIAVGLRQRESLSIIWREYSSLYNHFKYDDYSLVARSSFIPAKVAQEDPEAAAVAEISLARFYRDHNKYIFAIAGKLHEYPKNRFLLFRLIDSIADFAPDAIDPQLGLRITDRLIALEPDNAHYHYAKCYFLLRNRSSDDINAALEELEHANKCEKYGFAYDSYRQQAIDIAKRAKAGRYLLCELRFRDMSNPFASDIHEELMGQASRAFSDGDLTKGMRISDALADMQRRQFRDGDVLAICLRNLSFFSGAFHFGHWREPHGLELQRVNLTKERARKNRLELCSIIQSRRKETADGQEREKIKKERREACVAVHPAVHTGEMFAATLWACGALLFICAIRGFGEKSKIGFFSALFFIFGCVCYFCIAKGFYLLWFLEYSHCYGFSYINALRPEPGLKYFKYSPGLCSLFLGGPIVMALVLWGLGFVKPKKGSFWRRWYVRVVAALCAGVIVVIIKLNAAYYIYAGLWLRSVITGGLVSIAVWAFLTFASRLFRFRITRLLLVAVFFGLLTVLVSGYEYVHYVPMIVFILFSVIIAVVKPGEGSSLKTTLRLFSRKSDVAAVRYKCLRLIAPFIVVYWLLFIALVPLVAKCINLEFREVGTADRRVVLAKPNEAYKELMGKFEEENLDKMKLRRLLGLVMPEDLPALLQKLKDKEFVDYYWQRRPLRFRNEISKEEEKTELEKWKHQLNDDDLVLAMGGCGRDVVNIITGFLENPDSERALVARARLGDRTAKVKLEELLQTRLQSEPKDEEGMRRKRAKRYVDRPALAVDILSALACVSEPNEAAEWFTEYIQRREVPDLTENRDFLSGIRLLPTTQAQKVLKAYLAKTLSQQPSKVETLCDSVSYSFLCVFLALRRYVGFYGDGEIAESGFEIMLQVAGMDRSFEALEVSPYFISESAELLKKGLSSDSEDMRAWCVWQLRKIGYSWSKGELDTLFNDKSWKVRANAVMACGKEFDRVAEKDKNGFVRFTGSLFTEN